MQPTRSALRLLLLPALAGAAILVASPAASGTARPLTGFKPVIARPATVPARPVAGKRFTVSFKVTRSDNGAPLTGGRMICDPAVLGKVIRHQESFRRSIATLSFIIPASAEGKTLAVNLTIVAGGQSTHTVANFKVPATPKPSLSVGDASVVEGNSGSTTLSFPVALSTASQRTVTVDYVTSDGSATAPDDYETASGTLTLGPGETSKAITVTVACDSFVEPDETLTLTLSNPVNATVKTATATGTIRNDDVAPRSGHYAGSTANGLPISFDVAAGATSLGNFVGAVDLNAPGWIAPNVSFRMGGTVPIAPDLTFAATYSGSDADGPWTMTISGRLALPGNASGTLHVDATLNVPGHGQIQFYSGDVSWTASAAG
jgi:hypothetical protein